MQKLLLILRINNSVINVLEDIGISCDDDKSLLISRKISLDGKNICKVNGISISVSMLKKIGEVLVNVHGQLDNHNLLNEELHYTYIDNYAENKSIKDKYLSAYNDYCETRKQLNSLIVNESEKARKIDLLTYQINEIIDADIKIGEWEELEKRKKVLQNAEQLLNLVNNAVEIFEGNDNFNGVNDMLNTASSSLIKAAVYDESLAKISDSVADMSYNIYDFTSELKDLIYNFEIDPSELDIIEDRLNVLFKLSKKYGSTEEEIIEYLKNAQVELDNITFFDKKKDELEKELKTLKKAIEKGEKAPAEYREILRKANPYIVNKFFDRHFWEA